ncbi:Mu transposase domain-containing protein [Ferrithrix thermotolerans]|uniref:Mu transposase domain-containing protein n=1 Tax=Ferrithrix thermotolerans TaxID=209649 RepID=UPI003AF381F4
MLYSVPRTLRGHVVDVKITGSENAVFCTAEIVVHHERCVTFGSKVTHRDSPAPISLLPSKEPE